MPELNRNSQKELIFEQKATNILKHLKNNLRYGNNFLPRPFMIEFTGSPSSGKTTTIGEMYDFLRPLGFRVWRPQEGAEWVQHIPRTTPEYNIRTGLYALEKLMDEGFGHRYDIILFDRCIFDAYCWMEYWFNKSMLNSIQKQAIQTFFTLPFFTQKIDICYFMLCEPEEALRRQLRLSISSRPRETTTHESIKNIVAIWKRVFKNQGIHYHNMKIVDTTNISEEEMIDQMSMNILDTLEAKSIDSTAAQG